MIVSRKTLLAAACASVVLPAAAMAQPGAAAPAGKDTVAAKCFQCHTDSMFRDGRQDRRGWEATIYRMVGRGGLWTQDEISTMADYLSVALGPDVPPTAGQKRP